MQEFMGTGGDKNEMMRQRSERFGVSLRKNKREERIREGRRERHKEMVLAKVGPKEGGLVESKERKRVSLKEFVIGIGEREVEEWAKMASNEKAK